MSNSAQGEGLHAALSAVMRDLPAVGKNGWNGHQGYKFRALDDLVNALGPVLARHGVLMLPQVENAEYYTRGKQNVARLTVRYTLLKGAESVSVVTIGEGADVADKACNKAMSAALKYAIMQTFMVPTEDMADGDREHPAGTPTEPDRLDVYLGQIQSGYVWHSPDQLAELLAAAREDGAASRSVPLKSGESATLENILTGRLEALAREQ